jgi:uncharacterized protein YggE
MTLTVTRRSIAITVVAALTILAAYLVGSARPSVAGAATTSSVRTATGTANPADTGITVTGTGKVTGTPDTLRISLTVSATSPDVDTALSQANTSAKAVQVALLAKGVATKDLQTSNVSIQPSYTSKGQPNGYVVTESLTAALRDLTKAGTTISAAVSAGGDAVRIDGVSFSLEDTSGLIAGARTGAVDDAKAKAEQYAKAAGKSLGEVQSISEIVSTPNPVYADRGLANAAAAGSTAVPVQAGSQDVTVQVTVVYAMA